MLSQRESLSPYGPIFLLDKRDARPNHRARREENRHHEDRANASCRFADDLDAAIRCTVLDLKQCELHTAGKAGRATGKADGMTLHRMD